MRRQETILIGIEEAQGADLKRHAQAEAMAEGTAQVWIAAQGAADSQLPISAGAASLWP